MDYIFIANNELYHHGIKGQRWGIRRYQNEDGTLTDAGRKHYNKISDNQLQKELYKQVKAERAKQSSWYNKWNVNNTIGPNSKAVQDKFNADHKKWIESDEYKKADQKFGRLETKYLNRQLSDDDYNKAYDEYQKAAYKPEFDRSVVIGANRKYSTDYINVYGRDLNIGYLKDLGYTEDTAKEFTKRLLDNANKKLLNGM